MTVLRKDGTARVKIIQPGIGSSGYYSPEVLKRDGPNVFKAKTHVYWNHPTESEDRERPERSVSDLAGALATDAKFLDAGPAGPGLYADVQFFSPYREAIEELAPHVGMSIRALGKAKSGEIEGKKMPIVEQIVAARSVDVVTVPGAGGQVLQLFEAARGSKPAPIPGRETTVDEKEAQQLREANATLTAEVMRLKEATLRNDARAYTTEVLAPIDMPASARARVLEAQAAKPVVKDGALDREAYKTQIQEAGRAELAYLAEIGKSGAIMGMGSSTPQSGTALKEAWTGHFRRLGKSQEEAEKLAALTY